MYVEDYNSKNDEVLLYLHGGPGASCMDFSYWQAEQLSAHMRVICFDQRGVLRSDPLKEDESFGLLDLVADCEALRTKLGVKNWTVLGHSFGGILAFHYALLYPAAVNKVIFEAPTFDIGSSSKALIAKAMDLFRSIEHDEGVQACEEILDGAYTGEEMWVVWGRIGQLLGDHKDRLYFHNIEPRTYNEIIDRIVPSDDLWNKNQLHAKKLDEEGAYFKSLIPDFHLLQQPALLLAGLHDPICCEEQRLAFEQKVKDNRVVIFERSAHFPRIEEPIKYRDEVLKFIFVR